MARRLNLSLFLMPSLSVIFGVIFATWPYFVMSFSDAWVEDESVVSADGAPKSFIIRSQPRLSKPFWSLNQCLS